MMEVILSFALLGFFAINLVGAFLIVRDRQTEWQFRKGGGVGGGKTSLTDTSELASPRQPALSHCAKNASRRDYRGHSSSGKRYRSLTR